MGIIITLQSHNCPNYRELPQLRYKSSFASSASRRHSLATQIIYSQVLNPEWKGGNRGQETSLRGIEVALPELTLGGAPDSERSAKKERLDMEIAVGVHEACLIQRCSRHAIELLGSGARPGKRKS